MHIMHSVIKGSRQRSLYLLTEQFISLIRIQVTIISTEIRCPRGGGSEFDPFVAKKLASLTARRSCFRPETGRLRARRRSLSIAQVMLMSVPKIPASWALYCARILEFSVLVSALSRLFVRILSFEGKELFDHECTTWLLFGKLLYNLFQFDSYQCHWRTLLRRVAPAAFEEILKILVWDRSSAGSFLAIHHPDFKRLESSILSEWNLESSKLP